MWEWPGDVCPGKKGNGNKEGLCSILGPRGEPGHGWEGRESELCVYQITISSSIRDESLVLNEKLLWTSLLLPDSRDRNKVSNFSAYYFMTDFLPLPPSWCLIFIYHCPYILSFWHLKNMCVQLKLGWEALAECNVTQWTVLWDQGMLPPSCWGETGNREGNSEREEDVWIR